VAQVYGGCIGWSSTPGPGSETLVDPQQHSENMPGVGYSLWLRDCWLRLVGALSAWRVPVEETGVAAKTRAARECRERGAAEEYRVIFRSRLLRFIELRLTAEFFPVLAPAVVQLI
jgi:hypothetical protein